MNCGGLGLYVCGGLDVFLEEEAIALLDVVALFYENLSDPAEALGRHVGVSRGLNFAGRGYKRNQVVLIRHFRRLDSHHAFVRLVDAKCDDADEHRGHHYPDEYLFPRLHVIPLQSTLEGSLACCGVPVRTTLAGHDSYVPWPILYITYALVGRNVSQEVLRTPRFGLPPGPLAPDVRGSST